MDNTISISDLPILHTVRKAQNFPGSEYLLPADEKERERLLLQHDMLKMVFGENLVMAPLNPDDIRSVLDSGTGTGIWIMELASKLSPSAVLHGTDIETSLVPSDLPPNVSISTNTVTNLPSEWTDHFDLVHQRLLWAALRKSEWDSAVTEIYRVLRPGGYVQLTEGGSIEESSDASASQASLLNLIQRVFEKRDLLFSCASSLPALLEQAGFCNVTVEKRFVPLGHYGGEVGIIHSETLCTTLRGMKTPVLQAGGFGIVKSEEAFDNLVDDAEMEWNNIGGIGTTFYTIVAQKPTCRLGLDQLDLIKMES